MKVRFRNKLESFVRCEAQLWPDCGGPSNTFLPPHAVQGGKATQTYSFQGLGLNSDNSPLLENLFSFMTFIGSESQRNWGVGRQFQGGLQEVPARSGLSQAGRKVKGGGVRGARGARGSGEVRGGGGLR